MDSSQSCWQAALPCCGVVGPPCFCTWGDRGGKVPAFCAHRMPTKSVLHVRTCWLPGQLKDLCVIWFLYERKSILGNPLALTCVRLTAHSMIGNPACQRNNSSFTALELWAAWGSLIIFPRPLSKRFISWKLISPWWLFSFCFTNPSMCFLSSSNNNFLAALY